MAITVEILIKIKTNQNFLTRFSFSVLLFRLFHKEGLDRRFPVEMNFFHMKGIIGTPFLQISRLIEFETLRPIKKLALYGVFQEQ